VPTQAAPQQSAVINGANFGAAATAAAAVAKETEMVPVSKLTRRNYVAPEYPRAARRRNITGSVDVVFTVTTDGKVRSAEILRAEPEETFDDAALDAVTQWRFEPYIENGAAVEKRTAVRLAFDLQE
jgi:TonB family protein